MTAHDATPARGDVKEITPYSEAEVKEMAAAVERVLLLHANEPDALVTEDEELTCAHVSMLVSGIEHALDAVTRPACSGCGERFAEGDEIRAHIATCEKHPMSALTAERDALAQRVAALSEVVDLMGAPVCENLNHHAKRYYHNYDEPCPVIARINALSATPTPEAT